MYNEDGSDKKDDKDDKKAENEIKALRVENEALKAAAKHMGDFVKLDNARKDSEDITLENSTKNSGTTENRLENSRKFFTAKK